MSDLELQFECGAVRGKLQNVTPKSGNRLMCYCTDCQAFPTHLGKAKQTLDEAGGTEIYQIPPAKFAITQGKENIACLRLTPKGLNRWYTKCCNTPLGNTVGPGLPFVGIIHTFITPDQDKDSLIGPIKGNVNTGGATQQIPESPHKSRGELSLVAKVMRNLFWWKVTGQGSPNLLFQDGRPIVKPKILSEANVYSQKE